MKIFLSLILLIMSFSLSGQSDSNPLPACPNSPNCFRSELDAKNINKKPLAFKNDLSDSMEKLELLIAGYPKTTLENKSANQLDYTFKTKFGKFTDDVSFYFDKENKCIHFRSASRVGWSDMGANKRRMKRIRKLWNE